LLNVSEGRVPRQTENRADKQQQGHFQQRWSQLQQELQQQHGRNQQQERNQQKEGKEEASTSKGMHVIVGTSATQGEPAKKES
jgi:hypothetical protein